MEKVIVAVYDAKSKNYDPLMIFNNDAEAVRVFASIVEKNEIYKNWAQDFTLVKLGEFSKGKIKSLTPLELTKAQYFVKTKDEKTTGKN